MMKKGSGRNETLEIRLIEGMLKGVFDYAHSVLHADRLITWKTFEETPLGSTTRPIKQMQGNFTTVKMSWNRPNDQAPVYWLLIPITAVWLLGVALSACSLIHMTKEAWRASESFDPTCLLSNMLLASAGGMVDAGRNAFEGSSKENDVVQKNVSQRTTIQLGELPNGRPAFLSSEKSYILELWENMPLHESKDTL